MVADHREYVYFARPVGMDGPIKIGWSNSPEKRILSLMTWSPFPLELVAMISGDRALEKNIHECFADLHTHSEWFRAEPRLVKAVELIAAGVRVGLAIDLEKRVGRIGKYERKIVKRSPEFRRRQSFRSRLYWAAKRASRADERDCYYGEPSDVYSIMWRWGRDLKNAPTDEQIRRLEEVIADPATHCVLHMRDSKTGLYKEAA